jgi:hypothetical protein
MVAMDQAIMGSGATTSLSTSRPSTLTDGWSTAGLADSKFIKVFRFKCYSIQTTSIGIHKGIQLGVGLTIRLVNLVITKISP